MGHRNILRLRCRGVAGETRQNFPRRFDEPMNLLWRKQASGVAYGSLRNRLSCRVKEFCLKFHCDRHGHRELANQKSYLLTLRRAFAVAVAVALAVIVVVVAGAGATAAAVAVALAKEELSLVAALKAVSCSGRRTAGMRRSAVYLTVNSGAQRRGILSIASNGRLQITSICFESAVT